VGRHLRTTPIRKSRVGFFYIRDCTFRVRDAPVLQSTRVHTGSAHRFRECALSVSLFRPAVALLAFVLLALIATLPITPRGCMFCLASTMVSCARIEGGLVRMLLIVWIEYIRNLAREAGVETATSSV
jgi:hypothetical protein